MVFSYQTPSITIEEKFGQGVSSCCGIHGYMAQGPCDAKRKVKRGKNCTAHRNFFIWFNSLTPYFQGNDINVENVPICHDPAHYDYDNGVHFPTDHEVFNCSLPCSIKIEFLENESNLEINPRTGKKDLKLDDGEVINYCLSYACEDG